MMRDREDRSLREFFAAVHADDRAPAFERLARGPRPRRRASWKPAVAAAVLVAGLSLAWLAPRLGGPGLSEAEQMALASELSSWQAPLDFLLETPGREILSSAPAFDFQITTFPPPAEEETRP